MKTIKSKCLHESTRLEEREIVEIVPEEFVIVLFEEICEECDESVGWERHVFYFDHRIEED
jgi:hypothetical protein